MNVLSEKFSSFLLLGIKCVITRSNSSIGRITFPKIFDKLKPQFNILKIRDEKFPESAFHGMLEITAPKNKKISLHEAMDLGYSFQAVRLIYYFCVAKDYKDLSLLPLGKRILDVLPPWSLNDLVNLAGKEIESCYPSMKIFIAEFNSYTSEGLEDFINCMPKLARCVSDNNFNLAVSYLYKSITDLGIDSCDWQEENFDEGYDQFASDSDREGAFLNACKAIEAITGDLGSDKKKYFRKLELIGINPKELCGYKRKELLLNKIEKYFDLRDELSAHGSGRKRRFKIGEIIDFQRVAKHILFGSKTTYKLKQ